MLELLPNYPRRIRIDREVNDKYFEPIVNERNSPFCKKGKTGIYVISAALGFKNQLKKITQKGIDICNLNELDPKVVWLFFSIAICEKNSTDILLDGLNTIRIAEEYANGGAKMLYDKIFKEKFSFSMDNELIRILDKEYKK